MRCRWELDLDTIVARRKLRHGSVEAKLGNLTPNPFPRWKGNNRVREDRGDLSSDKVVRAVDARLVGRAENRGQRDQIC